MHIHILGICGSFMGGLAVIARQAGHRVSGCDLDVYPPMSTQLADFGVDIIEGYSPDQISLRPDLWVVGNVVTRGNPLMEEILDRGLGYMSGPQWFADVVLAGKWVLAVAGTHGKTTTSSMLAWILEAAGQNPGFLIGGVPENFSVSARATQNQHFVIEADEYDTAFFDKRSKFVHYRPKTVILNNIEFDHADIFEDIAAIENQFHQFVRTIPRRGRIIANAGDQSVARVLERGCWSEVERFGGAGEWSVRPVESGGFSVMHAGASLGTVDWDLVGHHNRMNALAAIAAARHAGIQPAEAVAALNRFRSVRRRLELKGVAGGVSVYDDFAHHPTAIATTIAGLRERVGAARILAVLEPRSNTMKLGAMKDRLASSLAAADLIFFSSAGLSWDPVAALAPLGDRTECASDAESLAAAVLRKARPGDHVLVMSNGSFGGIHARLLAGLRAEGR